MIIYITKVIISSGIFWFAYKIFLEKEKAHHYKRFYLLCSLTIAFIIPFISFETSYTSLPNLQTEEWSNEIEYRYFSSIPTKESVTEIQEPTITINYSFLLYVLLSLVLFIRFAKNLFTLYKTISLNEKIKFTGYTIVLIKENITAHSFLNYIFLNREEFYQNKIEKEILLHEKFHVVQKHSWDILFLELLQVIFWINPFLTFYRKAIRLNHEFLADEAVLKTYQDTPVYLNIILQRAAYPAGISITSQFNYSITKKRFIMMTKSKNTITYFKLLIVLPLIACTLWLFSNKTIAQKVTDTTALRNPTHFIADSVMLQNEYNAILKKYFNPDSFSFIKRDTLVNLYDLITKEDQKSLFTLYNKMAKSQQSRQYIRFFKYKPLAKTIPTKEQFEAFKNPNQYGVWINEKKVSNEVLNKYTHTDFSQVFVSKLYGFAKKNKSYNYQVDLMTNEFYNNYLKKELAEKREFLMLVVHPKKPKSS